MTATAEPQLAFLAEAPETADDGERGWPTRAAFLFFFVFALLFALPFPVGPSGIESPVAGWWDQLWVPVVPWVARNVFSIHYEFPRWGGGETTWYYVQVATAAFIALVASVFLAARIRKQSTLRRLDLYLRLYLRLFVAAAMFNYGWGKLLPVQFPSIGPDRLSQYVGEMSPQGLLWTFMGYSPAYAAFTGLAELVSGTLLAFRRTATIGALIGIAVMSNVVALNFAFDVGVKLDSMFYLMCMMYIATPGAHRIFALLVLNRATIPVQVLPYSTVQWKRVAFSVVPALIMAFIFARTAWTSRNRAYESGQLAPPSPLQGLYEVRTILPAGEPLDTGDSISWARVAIGQRRTTIRLTSGELGFYSATIDTVARSIRLVSRDAPEQQWTLHYAKLDSNTLVLRGKFGVDSAELHLRRDDREFRLTNHPFHWVKDRNDNR